MKDLKQLAADVRRYWVANPGTHLVKGGISPAGRALLEAVEALDGVYVERADLIRMRLAIAAALQAQEDHEAYRGSPEEAIVNRGFEAIDALLKGEP